MSCLEKTIETNGWAGEPTTLSDRRRNSVDSSTFITHYVHSEKCQDVDKRQQRQLGEMESSHMSKSQ